MKHHLQKRRKAYRFGLVAEWYAAAYLFCKGYRILAMRYRNFGGEIDILARRGETLVALEVKARRSRKLCNDSITWQKQKKIANAMNELSAHHSKIAGLADMENLNIRFDAVWVTPWQKPLHIQDAWRL